MAASTYYDETNCSRHESCPLLRFDVPHQEMWMKATSRKATTQAPHSHQPFRSTQSFPSSRSTPKGYCYSYNIQGVYCQNPTAVSNRSAPSVNRPTQNSTAPTRGYPSQKLKAKAPLHHPLPTPVNANKLLFYQQGYNQIEVQFLYQGFTTGF